MTIIIPAKRKFLAPPFVRTIDDPRDPLNLGLIAHWAMDAETVNATRMLDLSGSNNHGVLSASPPIVPGRAGQALGFNGSTQHVLCPQNAVGSAGAMTYSVWVNATSFPNTYHSTIVISNNTYFAGLWVKPSGKLACYVTYAAGFYGQYDDIGTYAIVAGRWYHLAMVASSTGIVGYVNGVQDGIAGLSNPVSVGPVTTTGIGYDPSNSGREWSGLLDDARVYNRALTPAEIWRLYNNPARDRVPYQTRARIGSNSGVTASSIISRRTLRQRTGSRA